ncbi:Uncharacterized protein APZ42_031031 [Daphnia magna]|uniref:Uncharacterized protein n=1 Tax=Daphnia magna TaxID=35525 RepID=A0A0P5Z2S9_9CRUS|nr:Uncharacterized protein APZ42_031031 [Daphnia magna]
MPEHSGKLSEFVDIAPRLSVSINLLLNSHCRHMRFFSFYFPRRNTTACTHIIWFLLVFHLTTIDIVFH